MPYAYFAAHTSVSASASAPVPCPLSPVSASTSAPSHPSDLCSLLPPIPLTPAPVPPLSTSPLPCLSLYLCSPLYLSLPLLSPFSPSASASAGADVTVCDREKMTALHWAAAKGFADVVELLLNRGANPNARDSVSVMCHTIYYYYIFYIYFIAIYYTCIKPLYTINVY
jgi:hypothetical protein